MHQSSPSLALTSGKTVLLSRAHVPSMPRVSLLLVFAALLAIVVSTHADESLFQRKTARRLTPQEQQRFGPKSAERRYDARMIRAAEIALRRAQPRMTWYCWRYVKDALVAADLVSSRPTSPYAKQAGSELCRKYGFTKTNVTDPWKAPVGAVVVYGGADAGHVELRTANGFVSDFISPTPYPRPLVGVYVKRS
jgi:hypothetical protein